MIIVYESKTGFTKKYAEILALKTGMKLFPLSEIQWAERNEKTIFLGWLKAGKIQGLNRARKLDLRAICATGTGSVEENSEESIITGNKVGNIPLFYIRSGCLPLRSLKGTDKLMMSMFLKFLKKRKDEKYSEAIDHIINGFDGVKEENLDPLVRWMNST